MHNCCGQLRVIQQCGLTVSTDADPVGSPAAHDARWSASVGLVAVGWVASAAAIAWCVLATGDTPGRLLIGVTALALATGALYGTRARPRLAADRTGISVGGLTGRTDYPWATVRRMRVVRTRRFGRDVPTLELETGNRGSESERLLVFGRLELGADPRDVADTLATLRSP